HGLERRLVEVVVVRAVGEVAGGDDVEPRGPPWPEARSYGDSAPDREPAGGIGQGLTRRLRMGLGDMELRAAGPVLKTHRCAFDGRLRANVDHLAGPGRVDPNGPGAQLEPGRDRRGEQHACAVKRHPSHRSLPPEVV